ncbi:unnamed protein product [Meloidogyne enterolobii]|uniref:Uncharacterized protein n=3 Tax=Meloidogyne enterolobii TaxID=390850 RepID=A0ACB1BAB7_MELEN
MSPLLFNFHLIFTLTIIQIIPTLIIGTTKGESKNNINYLDRNAFQMNFGKRQEQNNELINSLQKWPQMDGNTFRMSFGKKSSLMPFNDERGNLQREEILAHSNIAIPLLFDLSGPGLLNSVSSELAETEKKPQQNKQIKFTRKQTWPTRWRASLFRKRLDRNLFNVGFGK